MPPKLPLLIRQATLDDAASIAAVSVQSWQESYQGILDQDILNSLSVEQRLAKRLQFFSEKSSKGQFVACFGNTVVGFCDVGPARRPTQINSGTAKGEIYAIYVLNPYKDLGMGHSLFSAAVSFLHSQELCPFIAWALKENKRARTFYERQGGKICGDDVYTIAGKAYPEVCYRFD